MSRSRAPGWRTRIWRGIILWLGLTPSRVMVWRGIRCRFVLSCRVIFSCLLSPASLLSLKLLLPCSEVHFTIPKLTTTNGFGSLLFHTCTINLIFRPSFSALLVQVFETTIFFLFRRGRTKAQGIRVYYHESYTVQYCTKVQSIHFASAQSEGKGMSPRLCSHPERTDEGDAKWSKHAPSPAPKTGLNCPTDCVTVRGGRGSSFECNSILQQRACLFSVDRIDNWYTPAFLFHSTGSIIFLVRHRGTSNPTEWRRVPPTRCYHSNTPVPTILFLFYKPPDILLTFGQLRIMDELHVILKTCPARRLLQGQRLEGHCAIPLVDYSNK